MRRTPRAGDISEVRRVPDSAVAAMYDAAAPQGYGLALMILGEQAAAEQVTCGGVGRPPAPPLTGAGDTSTAALLAETPRLGVQGRGANREGIAPRQSRGES